MAEKKIRHLFPGGNTSRGFYSFYKYILPQIDAKKIICLKGGPGTGKSSFMKKLGSYYFDKGYTIEYHHCSSDNDSLDGVVIKEEKIALLDGTAPHVVDPVHPGAVDEILNLGIAFNDKYLMENKEKIMDITYEISQNFARAYRFLGAAKQIHDDWSNFNNEIINKKQIFELTEELKKLLFTEKDKTYDGKSRHLFSTAFTPSGIISYSKQLSEEVSNLIVLKGGPGTYKSEILDAIAKYATSLGHFVEVFHDPLIPERIENIIIPELDTGIFTTNEISRLYYSGITYNMKDYANKSILSLRQNEIYHDKSLFDNLIINGLSCISNAHKLHDDLEAFYISSMDFSIVNDTYDTTINKIDNLIADSKNN